MQKKLLVVFLVICTGISTSHFRVLEYKAPIDFRNLYLGARLWSNQQNPYIDSVLKQEWFSICDSEGISKNKPPGLPSNFLVYPPHALSLYWPISLFSWKTAVWINGFICFLSFVIWLVLVYRLFHYAKSINVLLLIMVAIAFKGTTLAFIVGQPSFLANLFGLAGVYSLLVSKKKNWAILFFILASFKPTTLLPYLIICTYHKNWKVLIYTFIGTAIWVAAAFLFYHQPLQLFQSAMLNINALKELIFEHSDFYYLSAGTELGLLLEYFVPQADWLRTTIYGILVVVLCVFLYRNLQLHTAYLLSLIMCFVLLTTHHLFYDALFLLPLIYVLPFYSTKIRWVILCSSSFYFLPINGILDRLHLTVHYHFLYLTTPASLLIIAIVLYLHPIKQNTSLPSLPHESLS